MYLHVLFWNLKTNFEVESSFSCSKTLNPVERLTGSRKILFNRQVDLDVLMWNPKTIFEVESSFSCKNTLLPEKRVRGGQKYFIQQRSVFGCTNLVCENHF